MARALMSETLTACCDRFAALKRTLPPATSVSGAERTALTHALYCPVCEPIARELRRVQAVETERLAAEAEAETIRDAIPVYEQAAGVLEANGFHRHYLWDTRQAAAGTPLELCRVDVVGALAIALHGSPTYAATPAVRKVEQFLVDRVPAPSLATWCSRPGVDQRAAVALLRGTADELRALDAGVQPADERSAA
jgi:hypothetical protein